MKLDCDVLVVGGGPAGCCAAKSASSNGAKTILIDKKQKIGSPVQCAEGMGTYLLPLLPFDIPHDQIIWHMKGMYFQTDDICIEKKGGFWESCSVNREKFDRWLATQSEKSGTDIYTNSELIDVEIDDKYTIKKAWVKKNGKTIEITPKVVVAADGVESTILQLLDLYHPKKGDIADVYSWEMNNLDLFKSDYEQIFSGEFTPSGYAYIFPNGKRSGNIGVGGIYPKKDLHDYFNEFLEITHVKKQVKNAEYVIEKSGKAVWNDLTDKWIYGNIVLTGDVANQNLKPFIEGILPSMICGDIAGNISSDLSNGKNVDHYMYKQIVERKIGEHLLFSNELLHIINQLYAKKDKIKYLQFFALITELIDIERLEDINEMEYHNLKQKIVRIIDEM